MNIFKLKIALLVCSAIGSSLFVSSIARADTEPVVHLSGDQAIDRQSMDDLKTQIRNLRDGDTERRASLTNQLFSYTGIFSEKYPKDVEALILRGALALELDNASAGALTSDDLNEIKASASPDDQAKIMKVLSAMNLKGWLDPEFIAKQKSVPTNLTLARSAVQDKNWEVAEDLSKKILDVDPTIVEARQIQLEADAEISKIREDRRAKEGADTLAKNSKGWEGTWAGVVENPADGSTSTRTITITVEASADPMKPKVTVSDVYDGEVSKGDIYSKSHLALTAPGELLASGTRKNLANIEDFDLPETSVTSVKAPDAEFLESGKVLNIELKSDDGDYGVALVVGEDGKVHVNGKPESGLFSVRRLCPRHLEREERSILSNATDGMSVTGLDKQ